MVIELGGQGNYSALTCKDLMTTYSSISNFSLKLRDGFLV